MQEGGALRLDLTGKLGTKVEGAVSYQWVLAMDNRAAPHVRGARNYQNAGRGCMAVGVFHTVSKSATQLDYYLRSILNAAAGVNRVQGIGGLLVLFPVRR